MRELVKVTVTHCALVPIEAAGTVTCSISVPLPCSRRMVKALVPLTFSKRIDAPETVRVEPLTVKVSRTALVPEMVLRPLEENVSVYPLPAELPLP